jgi:sigma-B regulation protein RsbU (phosphoserine phosphatase)
MPLGIMEDAEYEEQIYGPLAPGQILFVGTDGVWEMPNDAGQQFGKQRLRETIIQAATGTAEEISTAIRGALTEFRGTHRAVDDVTFVILKKIGE